MNYVVWDIETDSAQTDWATIIEIGGILLDENFKEKERFQARCRLPQDRVPSATALCINKSNVDLLTKGNLSHYEMLTQVEQKFREWSPATFLGYSSINFDDEVIRKEFFKSLRKPYSISRWPTPPAARSQTSWPRCTTRPFPGTTCRARLRWSWAINSTPWRAICGTRATVKAGHCIQSASPMSWGSTPRRSIASGSTPIKSRAPRGW